MTPPCDRKRRGGAARRPKVEKIKRSGWWRKAGVACCICSNYHSAAASTDAPSASATVHTGLKSPDLKVMQVSVVPARLNDLQQVQHEMCPTTRGSPIGASSAHFASPAVSNMGAAHSQSALHNWHGVVSECEGAVCVVSTSDCCGVPPPFFSPPTSQAHALLNANGHI